MAQLIAVRGAIQTAIGLTANAADEVTDALAKAEDALAGANHDLAMEGLGLWRRAQSGDEFTVAKLVAADEALAEYLEILSPGSGAGTKNTDIAKPSGEELVKARPTGSRSQNLFRTMVQRDNDIDDAMKDLGKHQKFLEISDPDWEPPPTYTTNEVGHRIPVMTAPDAPQPDAASIGSLAVASGILIVAGAKKAKDITKTAIEHWRSK
ncbi:hypothetical protein [Phytomonospora endophytica]|uniref:Uncharacterized protein n=1 Tax=Phytomonospora endophytica TaxID=714109 RepID=A0A841FM08_9ACTN|nr:hypothetical protein [Phytomonospora endophytica]MBB6037035.1 hypothetical protein [Phytomonospora endophytica]